jgi:hypothetical protein
VQNTTWISLLEVEERGAAGERAFVNGLCRASTAHEAEAVLAQALEKLGWAFISAEDTEPFGQHCAHHRVAMDLRKLGKVVDATGVPQFGDFYVWAE